MNIFEEEGFVENVIMAEKHEGCLLCKKKYKQEKTTPVGKECEKKLKKQYNFAVLNIASGCNEAPDVWFEKKDLQKYFGSSVDIIISTAEWGGFYCEWLWKEGQIWYWEESLGEDETFYEEMTPEELELLMVLTGKTNAELTLVHEDMWGLTVVQHSRYLGPCKTWDEYVKRYGCTPQASCYCGRYYEDIKEEIEELEFKLAEYERMSLQMRFCLIDYVKEAIAKEEDRHAKQMDDVRLGLRDPQKGQFGVLESITESLWFEYKRLEERPTEIHIEMIDEELGETGRATIELVH